MTTQVVDLRGAGGHPEPAVTEITGCLFCGCTQVTPVISLGDQYVVDFPEQPQTGRIRAPLKLGLCHRCGLLQLYHHVHPDLLFQKFWYRSGVNERMVAALQNVVTSSQRFVDLQAGDAVLDIGSNDGTLLAMYPKRVYTVGFEPCRELVEEAREKQRANALFVDYFKVGDNLCQLLREQHQVGFKIITALAMFYDLAHPLDFLRDIGEVLHPNGVLVLQLNSLRMMVQQLAFDNVCHEHLAYYSFQTLRAVLRQAGLSVIDVEENDVNGGSMRVYATHSGHQLLLGAEQWAAASRCQQMEAREEALRLRDPQIYAGFAKDVQRISRTLSNYIRSGREQSVYVYGASTRGTTLLQTLNPGVWPLLCGAADRDERKWGRYMVGSWTPIVSEEEARAKANYFLVLPYHFLPAILEREQKWLASGGRLIVPLPVPRVIGANGVGAVLDAFGTVTDVELGM